MIKIKDKNFQAFISEESIQNRLKNAKKELEKIKQGKRSDELICKALDKVMKKSLKKRDFSFLKHFSAVFAKQDTDAV